MIMCTIEMATLLIILTSVFLLASCQIAPNYETHRLTSALAPATVTPFTETRTETVLKTHPLRVRVTSDVWITETTNVNEVVTAFVTVYSYFPANPRTVTSVMRVTSTPVIIRTVEIMVTPTLTVTSVFTSFVTTTQTVRFWQSITHVSVAHSVLTVPVWSTQTLVQEETTTVTQALTTTVTSFTKNLNRGYLPPQ
ncbi:chondroitin proteoglycan 1-like isoform X1 [Palaemon carinicauda]|uniref:chondroitin proteoglycan 1-like isoform X1 n=2 Tax=Palaemon carinicauda TaxID=392227 RepID=UPI0035B65106